MYCCSGKSGAFPLPPFSAARRVLLSSSSFCRNTLGQNVSDRRPPHKRTQKNKHFNKLFFAERTLYLLVVFSLKLFESSWVGEQLPGQSPDLLGRVLHGAGALASEQIQIGQEVVRASLALQARDELQQNAVEPVPDGVLLPLGVPRVLLALVQQQCLHGVSRHRVAGQLKMVVPQCLEHAQALSATTAEQQSVLCLGEWDDECVSLHGRLFALQSGALLWQQVESLRLDFGHQVGMRPRDVRERPVRGRAGPHAAALERRSYLASANGTLVQSVHILKTVL